MVNISGDLAIGPIEKGLDVSFSDIWSDFEIGGAVFVEFGKDKHSVHFDYTYLRMRTDPTPLPSPSRRQKLVPIGGIILLALKHTTPSAKNGILIFTGPLAPVAPTCRGPCRVFLAVSFPTEIDWHSALGSGGSITQIRKEQ